MKAQRKQGVQGRRESRRARGFAMLFAVLVSSVLLAVGLSIFNLTVKELVLSSSGRESQFAFYAADTGAECALYWDFKGTDIFATSTDSRTPSSSNPDCVDTQGQPVQTINISPSAGATSNSASTVFSLSIPNTVNGASSPYCAMVTVSKMIDPNTGVLKTVIDSRGYNVGTAVGNGCQSTDPTRVERALEIAY